MLQSWKTYSLLKRISRVICSVVNIRISNPNFFKKDAKKKKKSVENYKEVLSLRQGKERSTKGDWIRLIVVNMYGEAEEFKGD